MFSLYNDETWDRISNCFSLVGSTRDVINFCIKDKIDPDLFLNNVWHVTKQKLFEEQVLVEPTPSINDILSFYLPPAYPGAFASAYPDVVKWLMEQEDPVATDNKWLQELFQNNNKYITEKKQLNRNGMSLAIIAFKKSPGFVGFECRLEDEGRI